MSEHRFTVTASWAGGISGQGELCSEGLQSGISVPATLGGRGEGTNPEELLFVAAASCFLITLSVILSKRSLPFEKLEVATEGFVLFDKGLKITKIVHHPCITVPATATAAEREQVLAATQLAEQGCMISRAIHGNVEVSVDARLAIG
jgi:peroxiredoxin-like protein